MFQLEYLHVVPRDPLTSSPQTMVLRDIYAMYDDLYNHMVLDETQFLEDPRE